MDTVTNLINQFKAEETANLDSIDKSEKSRIISSLEDFTDDDRVIEFLLYVAANEGEYYLARIEVFKLLEIKDFANSDTRIRVARVIQRVLANSQDADVRNYAAMAAASYMDINGMFGGIERILHDKKEDSNLRWNAFAAIKAAGHSVRSVDSLRRLLRDKEFEQSATRVLSEWHED